MDPLSIALGLSQFVPAIAKWVTGSDKAAEVAGKVVDIAKVVTGKDEPDQALAAIQADPNMALQFKTAVLAQGTELERLALANASDVNKTMQAEAASEHWPTYSWRPAIGFAVALAVVLSVLTVFTAYVAAMFFGKADGLAALPGILGAVAAIIGVVSPILGIASWFRGKAQADPSIPTINRG